MTNYDVDIAIYAPYRSLSFDTVLFLSTLRELTQNNFQVVVVDTSNRDSQRIPGNLDKLVVEHLANKNVQVASAGSAYRVQKTITIAPVASQPIATTGVTVVADSTSIILDSSIAADEESYNAETLDKILEIYNSVSGRVELFATSDLQLNYIAEWAQKEEINLSEGLWNCIFDPRFSATSENRALPVSEEAPSVGRHIIGTEPRWPQEDINIRRVFPTTADWSVNLYGPHARLTKILGRRPELWNIHSAFVPSDLSNLHFWVPAVEHFEDIPTDTAVYQAIASGLVVVLPPKLQPIFGEGAIYAEPHGVRSIIKKYHSDNRLYEKQSKLALEFAQANSSAGVLDRLARDGVTVPLAHPFASRTSSIQPRSGKKYRIAFVTSNGAGMGHLTRLLAIARRLPDNFEAVFISLSQAVPVVKKFGFPFIYIASKNESGLSPAEWNKYGERRFREEFAVVQPDFLIFDGTWPYRGLLAAAKAEGIPMIWSRRGMWKEDILDTSLAFSERFDEIIEPGEFAAPFDKGATTRVRNSFVVNPVTVLSKDELLSEEDARQKLGINPDEKAVLVTLGAGNLNNTNETTQRVVESLQKLPGNWRIFLTNNPIAAGQSVFTGVDSVEIYPIVEYANAFDFTVSAAGYNSFHEWMMACIPTVWIPNLQTQTDDQLARAEFAEHAGVGINLSSEDLEAIAPAIEKMADHTIRSEMKIKLIERWVENGAQAAADRIVETVLGDNNGQCST